MQNVNISLDVCSIITFSGSREKSSDVTSHLSCAPALRWHQLWQKWKTALFLTRNNCFDEFWSAPWRVLWGDIIRIVRQSCIMTSRHNSSKHHCRIWNNDILHLCLMKGASQFESCHFTTHLTTHLTTDLIIHSKGIFLKGIVMFCIAVIFDVSAQLGRLLTSRLSSRLINKSSTKSWLSTPLTKYWHVAFMSETTFRRLRLLRASDVTTRLQNVNITLYQFHFLESCCELNEMKLV